MSYLLYYPSLALSRAFGAIDLPNKRKIHSTPTARGGGFMFFVAFSLAITVVPIDIDLKIPLLLGGTVMFLIGFLDDVICISPFMKLSGQFLGISVYFFTCELLGFEISILYGILSAIWIVFITNATNIIDGLDGLAGGICAVEALCVSLVAFILNNDNVFICSLLLMSAILGFLPRNFPKARIFMGDCGALFLGFTLAIISSRLVIESNSIACLLSMLLIFRVPIYDTNLSIIRRIIKRQNPLKADKEHFHHLLLRMGFSKECASLLLITASLLFGFIGIVIISIPI